MAHGSEVLHGFSGFMPIFRRCKQKIGGGGGGGTDLQEKKSPSTTKPARQHWAGFAQILGRSFISLFNCSSWKKHSVKTKSEWRNMLKPIPSWNSKTFRSKLDMVSSQNSSWIFSRHILAQGPGPSTLLATKTLPTHHGVADLTSDAKSTTSIMTPMGGRIFGEIL